MNEETKTNALVQAENQPLAVPAEIPAKMQALAMNFQLQEIFNQRAKMMARSNILPAIFRGDEYACYSLLELAYCWETSATLIAPWFYKSTANSPLSMEGKGVKAILDKYAPVKDHFIEVEYFGDWSKILGKFSIKTNKEGKQYRVPSWKLEDEEGLGIRLSATLLTGQKISDELTMSQCLTRNSTLWAENPKLQIFYREVAVFCRRFFPGLLCGMYVKEELADGEIIDVKVVKTEPLSEGKAKSKSDEVLNKIKKGKQNGKTEEVTRETVATAEQTADEKESISNYLGGYFKQNNVPLNLLDVKRYLELDRKLTMDMDSPELPAEWDDYIRNRTNSLVNAVLDWIEKQSNGGTAKEGDLI